MADIYKSTNKLADNPYPERSHLLLEGIIDIPTSDYSSYSGGYLATSSLNISNYIKLGNRKKSFDPQTLEAKCWKTTCITPSGQVDDYYYALPLTKFYDLSTGQVDEWAICYVHNIYITADDVSTSYMTIEHYVKTAPGRTQSFSYKIYNTIYNFTDTQ